MTSSSCALALSDVLWDGTRLYVASHVRASSSAGATTGNPARLYRLSYDPVTKTYSRDAGFPVQINKYSSETLTIDKDSTGTLWATWAQGSKVYVNNTTGGDATWGTPGTIFMKSSPMGSIAFPDGRGTPVTRDARSPNMNNATTTKQHVNSVTGMVVLASNDATQRYWHADLPLGSS